MTRNEYLLMLKSLMRARAAEDFFFYCKNKAPDFYKDNRAYLVDLCNKLSDFYLSNDDVLVVNIPPRHGKSRTAMAFCEWVLGRNIHEKIMVGSYNEKLSGSFSKGVRGTIGETGGDITRVNYSNIFPNTQLKKGDTAAERWTVEGGFNSFLATSPRGSATGFGATLLIIDDLIKSAYEAYNEEILKAHWDWFTGTMLSRLEEGGKVVIIMTRWHTNDLAGRALRHFEKIGAGVRQICYKALGDDGVMLCPEILSFRSYNNRIQSMGQEIAEANYQQLPIDVKGRLYSGFRIYEKIPVKISGVYNYTDTADCGGDYLCSVNYVVSEGEAYVTEVIYSKEAMEVTEPLVAEMLYRGEIMTAYVEANNGGRGFARSVERILKDKYSSNRTSFESFHQSKNKASRILSNATWVMAHIYFPRDWEEKYDEFYKALVSYNREGKNKHDDAPDVVTGIAERVNAVDLFSFN